MTFRTAGICMPFLMATLVSSSRLHPQDSVEMLTDIVISVQEYVRSGCVFFLCPTTSEIPDSLLLMRLERSVNRQGVLAAAVSTRTIDQAFNCRHNRPLFVSLFTDPTIQQSLIQLSSTIDISEAKWLQFMNLEQVEEYFGKMYVPLDCQFIVAQPGENGAVTFTEVYHIGKNQRLMTFKLGEWVPKRGSVWTNTTFYTRRGDLQGVSINAAVISDGAICNITEMRNNKPVRVEGFFGTLWNALQYRLNFTSEFMKPTDGNYGSMNRRKWSGMIGMLVRQEADVAVGAYIMTERLLQYVNFASPMGRTKIAVFVRSPRSLYETSWDSYLAPFSIKLWVAVLCAILVLTVGLAVTFNIGRNIGNEESGSIALYSLYDSFIYVFGCFCQQGHERTPRSWPCRLVYLTAYLTAVVLFAAYSATFISFLAVRHTPLPFKTFEEMLQDGTYKLGILNHSVELNFFDTATEAVMQQVYDQLILPTMDDAPPDTLAGLQRVCDKSKYGFVVDSTRAASVMNNVTCELEELPHAFIPATGTFVIGKHSPYRRIINSNLESMRRHGELGWLFHHAMPSMATDTSSSILPKVQIQEVLPVLVIIAASLVVANAFLVMERCIHRLVYRYRHRQRLCQCDTRFVNSACKTIK